MDTRLDALKTASKEGVHKAGEFLENKIIEAVNKSNSSKIQKQETVEEIINQTEKTEEILNELRQALLIKWNTIKYLFY